MGGRVAASLPAPFGRTRSALLALLYGHSDQSFHLRQMARVIGGGLGALPRELRNLAAMGLVVRTTKGNQVLYPANSQSPIFLELRSPDREIFWNRNTILAALGGWGEKVEVALAYGSVARQQELRE